MGEGPCNPHGLQVQEGSMGSSQDKGRNGRAGQCPGRLGRQLWKSSEMQVGPVSPWRGKEGCGRLGTGAKFPSPLTELPRPRVD